jgi:hypothetical protein
MPLQRGEVRGYDFNRMTVEFTMLNQGKVILYSVSTAHQPYSEMASRSMANTIVDVAALEAAIDIKHLPRQDLSSEVYQ